MSGPATLFLSLVAVAGGLFFIGLAVLALALVWAYVVGWTRRP